MIVIWFLIHSVEIIKLTIIKWVAGVSKLFFHTIFLFNGLENINVSGLKARAVIQLIVWLCVLIKFMILIEFYQYIAC